MDSAEQCSDLAQHKLIISQIEQLATSILLTAHRHNFSERAESRRNTVLPRHVRRSQDYLHAHAHEPICAGELAQIAGISLRDLYTGFKEFLAVSSMHDLRDLHMERTWTGLMGAILAMSLVLHCAGASPTWDASAANTSNDTDKLQARGCHAFEPITYRPKNVLPAVL